MVGDDRGQLILVGSIAIALILIGLVVVVNSAVYTETVGDQGTVETVKEAGTTGLGIERSVAATVAGTDAETVSPTPADPSDEVANLSSHLVNRTADTQGAFVGVEYNRTIEEGTRIRQSESEPFTNVTGLGDWQLMNSTTEGDVGEFDMVVDVTTADQTDVFEVYVNGSGGNSSQIFVTGQSDPQNLTVVSWEDAPGGVCAGIRATGPNDTVRLDFDEGTIYEDRDCTFDPFRHVDPPYTVEFRNGSDVEGTYRIATNSSYVLLASNLNYGASAAVQPHVDAVVWTAGIAYTYDVDEATTVTEEKEVEIYG